MMYDASSPTTPPAYAPHTMDVQHLIPQLELQTIILTLTRATTATVTNNAKQDHHHNHHHHRRERHTCTTVTTMAM